VRRENLNVFDLPFTVGTLVLDPDVGQMDVPIDDRQVMTSRPLCDLEGICVAFSPATFAIEITKKSLVVPLELVVQNHPPHDCASTPQAVGSVQVGAVELRVMGQLARLHDACVELLTRLLRIATTVSLEEMVPTVGERDEGGLLATHDVGNRVDQPGFPQLPEIAVSRIQRPLAMIEQVLRGHDPKRTGSRQDTHLRRTQIEGLIPVSNGASGRTAREIERA
jgi:hypothetical protein